MAQDSDMMKTQSRRATLLTLLAAFYLPLTLVTGIFGMNIKEFDTAKPPFKLCFGAFFAVITVTLVCYGLFRYLPLAWDPIKLPVLALFKKWPPFRQVYNLVSYLEESRRKRRSADRDLEHGFDKNM